MGLRICHDKMLAITNCQIKTELAGIYLVKVVSRIDGAICLVQRNEFENSILCCDRQQKIEISLAICSHSTKKEQRPFTIVTGRRANKVQNCPCTCPQSIIQQNRHLSWLFIDHF